MNVLDPRTPVIVGVGQVNVTSADAGEPAVLLTEAASIAGRDSGAEQLLKRLDSVRIVKSLSWKYRDLGALVAHGLGASPTHTVYSTDGGQTPQALVNRAASDIQAGHCDVVLIGGVEAWRQRMAFKARGLRPDWTHQPEDVAPSEVFGPELFMVNDYERSLGLSAPIHFYPLFESALRHASGRSLDEHIVALSELWARFSDVAADNPNAALPRRYAAEEIRAPGPTNRMIGYPYTKLMNSNNSVNQAAALLVCSVEAAHGAGVPADRMVFPVAGGEADDVPAVSNRPDLASSPAIRAAGRAALELAGVGVDDIAHVDLYSCFPSAVQVAAAELGLSLDRQLTVTGGLTFAGGPWNNYVGHSIATMVDALRDAPGFGLISANGGLITKHAVGVYATEPPSAGFRAKKLGCMSGGERTLAASERTTATVEAYTVMHDRAGEPERAHLSAILPDGRRGWGVTTDREMMTSMTQTEWCGSTVELLEDGNVDVP
jgi:acetyl-CoA C-acetyltransferase